MDVDITLYTDGVLIQLYGNDEYIMPISNSQGALIDLLIY